MRARKKMGGHLRGNNSFLTQLQQAGLIRADLPVQVIRYVITVLTVGIVTAPDLLGETHLLSTEQLTVAFSDLIRCWLLPEQLKADPTGGKQALAEWLRLALTQPR